MKIIVLLISLAALLYGLLRPEAPPYAFQNSDKLLHILAFATVSLASRITIIRTPAWLLWSGLCLFAVLSEWLQNIVQSTRQFSWLDVCANLMGVLLAASGWYILLCATKILAQKKQHEKL